jgi:hypothetical protein
MITTIESIIFECDECFISLPLEGTSRFRRSVNDVVMPVLETPCLCRDCRRVTYCEGVPTIHDLEDDLAILAAAPQPNESVGLPSVAELQDLIRWRAQRVGPSRCLTCGSTNISVVSLLDGEYALPHLACGGTLRSARIHYRDGERETVTIDAEGRRSV